MGTFAYHGEQWTSSGCCWPGAVASWPERNRPSLNSSTVKTSRANSTRAGPEPVPPRQPRQPNDVPTRAASGADSRTTAYAAATTHLARFCRWRPTLGAGAQAHTALPGTRQRGLPLRRHAGHLMAPQHHHRGLARHRTGGGGSTTRLLARCPPTARQSQLTSPQQPQAADRATRVGGGKADISCARQAPRRARVWGRALGPACVCLSRTTHSFVWPSNKSLSSWLGAGFPPQRQANNQSLSGPGGPVGVPRLVRPRLRHRALSSHPGSSQVHGPVHIEAGNTCSKHRSTHGAASDRGAARPLRWPRTACTGSTGGGASSLGGNPVVSGKAPGRRRRSRHGSSTDGSGVETRETAQRCAW